ncbi:MAG: hypothetical protein ACW99G_06415 [Candidatus Thorarchaeota archaeon]|jgi:hypothetical protein
MSTKFEFDNETIERFCIEYGVTTDMTLDQLKRLKTTGKTQLLVDQLDNFASQICTDDDCLRKFIEQKSILFHPVAMTLYVLNDDLWKIMARKHEHPEKMLPMTTIPWFYWEKEAEGRKNPTGVLRKEHPSRPLTVIVDEEILMVKGNGGDFCGVLEGRIVDRHKGIRPIIVPGLTGPKKNVAKYESEFVQIRINVHSAKMNLYPAPEKELDYIYSEHPRVFYDHGVQITADGEDVALKVGRRKETTLRGKVIIFIGKFFDEKEDSEDLLLFHVWLSMLKRTPFL